jgi:hypothetical protein
MSKYNIRGEYHHPNNFSEYHYNVSGSFSSYMVDYVYPNLNFKKDIYTSGYYELNVVDSWDNNYNLVRCDTNGVITSYYVNYRYPRAVKDNFFRDPNIVNKNFYKFNSLNLTNPNTAKCFIDIPYITEKTDNYLDLSEYLIDGNIYGMIRLNCEYDKNTTQFLGWYESKEDSESDIRCLSRDASVTFLLNSLPKNLTQFWASTILI